MTRSHSKGSRKPKQCSFGVELSSLETLRMKKLNPEYGQPEAGQHDVALKNALLSERDDISHHIYFA